MRPAPPNDTTPSAERFNPTEISAASMHSNGAALCLVSDEKGAPDGIRTRAAGLKAQPS
jgi:hypothetical protein